MKMKAWHSDSLEKSDIVSHVETDATLWVSNLESLSRRLVPPRSRSSKLSWRSPTLETAHLAFSSILHYECSYCKPHAPKTLNRERVPLFSAWIETPCRPPTSLKPPTVNSAMAIYFHKPWRVLRLSGLRMLRRQLVLPASSEASPAAASTVLLVIYPPDRLASAPTSMDSRPVWSHVKAKASLCKDNLTHRRFGQGYMVWAWHSRNWSLSHCLFGCDGTSSDVYHP